VVLSLIGTLWLVVSVAGERWVVVTFDYYKDQTCDWGLWNTCHVLAEEYAVCVDAGTLNSSSIDKEAVTLVS